MAHFHFRLASLLQYRENLRDQCRQILAQWLQRDADLAAEQQRLEQERELQLAEMSAEQVQQTKLQVDKLVSRRYRAGQLSAELSALAQRRSELAEQIALCRKALLKADQGVKALEQLAEKQRAEFRYAEERREAREREEIWQAGHWKDR
jgi:flagellar export protein FliJ